MVFYSFLNAAKATVCSFLEDKKARCNGRAFKTGGSLGLEKIFKSRLHPLDSLNTPWFRILSKDDSSVIGDISVKNLLKLYKIKGLNLSQLLKRT